MRFLFGILLLSILLSCSNSSVDGYSFMEGKTMGTYYKITYKAADSEVAQSEIEQLLIDINNEVSTYIDTSIISKFNQSKEELVLEGSPLYSSMEEQISGHFMANFMVAKEIYLQSGGYFDPTVMPLVNYWGFGYSKKKPVESVDSTVIDSLLEFVGFDKVELISAEPYIIKKGHPGAQLDFSAIAKGYAVDVLGKWLESYDVQDYLVDIGGELRAMGKNSKEEFWRVGINKPEESSSTTELFSSVPLKDQSIATSGNYRNFYEVNGQKFSHTINPTTGFPERSNLLSASVFSEDCIVADAFATAFMTMGLDRAFEMASGLSDLEAYFIYSKEDGGLQVKYTEGLNTYFE